MFKLLCSVKKTKSEKGEKDTIIYPRYTYNKCPDCDKKRTTVCKNLTCNSQKH